MWPVEIKSRDGLTLVSYLTLPRRRSRRRRQGERAVPMVLFVHGGPWARDRWGYNPMHQLLANRGYAVLQRQLPRLDRLRQEVHQRRQPPVGPEDARRPDRRRRLGRSSRASPTEASVAIMGGSYGGYATLAGLTLHARRRSRAASTSSAPRTCITLSRRSRRTGRRSLALLARASATRTTAEGKALLDERVAAHSRATRSSSPLLIGQGANDPRVKQAESEQIVAAMQAERTCR